MERPSGPGICRLRSSCGKNNDCDVVMVIMVIIWYGGSRNYGSRDDSY